jgi:DNA recombination protein RmuC
LIALLKTVGYGWRQESLAANAREISEAARELYDRLRVFAGHLAGVRKGLGQAVDAYNKAMGSYQLRVLPSGRRLEELGPAAGQTLESLEPLDAAPRALPVGEGAEPD